MQQLNLYQCKQWVVWRLEYLPGEVKPTKIPVNPLTLSRASSTDPNTWTDFATASAMLSVDTSLRGVGFILTPNDPYFLLDLDGCRDIDTGMLTAEAAAICSAFPGSAWEISQSGEGIHIIGQCDVNLTKKHRNKWDGWCEFYTQNRFIAFGPGNGALYGNPDINWTDTLRAVVPLRPTDQSDGNDGMEGPRADWKGPTDDDELIKRILASKGGPAVRLGQAPTPSALWHGDAHVLGAFYPDAKGLKPFDWSSADQALLNVLAYWTGCDHERMIRLFSRSALANRDKWTKRGYYRRVSTSNSVRTTSKVYGGSKEDVRNSIRAEQQDGNEFTDARQQLRNANAALAGVMDEIPDNPPQLTIDEMLERFRYIEKSTAIVDAKTGVIYPSDTVASKKFTSSVTTIAGADDKPKQLPTFKLWFSDPRRVDRQNVNWLPNGDEKLRSLDHPGQSDYNLWRGFIVPQYAEQMRQDINLRESWLQAWRAHLAFLVPIESERIRFEQWIAHMIQRPEELPHTAYLMWTETQGVGRNLLATMICRVLMGYVLPNVELAKLLDASFNSQLSRKLLVIVDEIKEGGDSRERYKRENQIRQVITADTRQINEKNVKERTEHARVRWLFYSNHPDALPFSNTDRRIIVIKNPDATASNEYYDQIIATMDRPEFVAALFAHLKWGVSIESFKAGEHAPMNEAKKAAIRSMENPVVSDLKEMAATMQADSIVSGTSITATLAMDYGTSTDSFNSRTWASYLKSAGFVQIPHKIKLFGKAEMVYIVRPEKTKVSDYFDESTRNLISGASDYIRRVLSGS